MARCGRGWAAQEGGWLPCWGPERRNRAGSVLQTAGRRLERVLLLGVFVPAWVDQVHVYKVCLEQQEALHPPQVLRDLPAAQGHSYSFTFDAC